MQIKQK